MYAGGPGGAFGAVDAAFTVTLGNGGGGGTVGGGGGVGNWVDNGVFPGFRILNGVPPEGFEDCLALPLPFCDCDLGFPLPPLVLDDDTSELEVSIATKTTVEIAARAPLEDR